MNITESFITTQVAVTTSSFIEEETSVATSVQSTTAKNILTSNRVTTTSAPKPNTSTSIVENITGGKLLWDEISKCYSNNVWYLALQTFKRTNEEVYGIWKTITGGNSRPSSAGGGNGDYWPTEPPKAALDGNITTEYTNHGYSDDRLNITSGMYTGLYFTIHDGPFHLTRFRMATCRYSPVRDPMTITIEGSNKNPSELTHGKSWTLIYRGSSGLDKDTKPSTYGYIISVANNSVSFRSYRPIVTSVRGIHNSVSYSEFEMMGQYI